MASVSYQYRKPTETYTIEQFIACKSDTEINYNNLSFRDSIEYKYMEEFIYYPTYNILSDYVDEIRDEYCLKVSLSDDDMYKYKYRPKLLCHKIYGNTELAFILLIINDMYSVKQFTKSEIYMPTKPNMSLLCKYLMNSNLSAIKKYNKQTGAI